MRHLGVQRLQLILLETLVRPLDKEQPAAGRDVSPYCITGDSIRSFISRVLCSLDAPSWRFQGPTFFFFFNRIECMNQMWCAILRGSRTGD